jgi:probable phosphomutase (TIGR03848 family)
LLKILLIRHGENDWTGKRLIGRLPGVSLNAAGRAQAQAVARALSGAPIRAIYASPMERAQETAQPLADLLGLPIISLPGLLEVDYGSWQGKTSRQVRRLKLWKKVKECPSQVTFPLGESFLQSQQRGVSAIETLRNTHPDNSLIACFSHCDLIRLILAHYMSIPLDNFQCLSIDTCSISLLEFSESRIRLNYMNRTAADHLVVDRI